MKKILMTLVAAMATVSMSAQYYVGGTLGFGSSKDKTNPAAELSTSSFRINPEIGMALDDKLGVGIVLDFQSNTRKTENTVATPTTSVETTITRFALEPYARYQFLKFGKANIFIDGGLSFGITSQKDMKAGMDLALFAQPGVAFDINDQWSIVAKFTDMFWLGYSKQPIADVAGAPDAPSSFDFGASTGGFNLGGLNFGVYYKF